MGSGICISLLCILNIWDSQEEQWSLRDGRYNGSLSDFGKAGPLCFWETLMGLRQF